LRSNPGEAPLRATERTRCEIVGEVDDDAEFINIGVMSIGADGDVKHG
jgi:hypothetical protein